MLRQSKKVRDTIVGVVVTTLAIIITLVLFPSAAGMIRTLVTLLHLYEPERKIYFIVIVSGVGLLLSLFIHAIFNMIKYSHTRTLRAYEPWAVAAALIIFVSVMVKANLIIHDGIKEYSATLEAERYILEKVLTECDREVIIYVDDVPEVYDRQFGSISDRVLPITACAGEEDIVVIASKEKELYPLIHSGYSFGELSNVHGIYTNNERVIQLLKHNGIEMTPFYSVVQYANMSDMAATNGLEMTEDGGLLLEGSQKSINHGPWVALYRGRVKVNFEIQIVNDVNQQNAIGSVRIASDSGMRVWYEREITKEEIDDTGCGTIVCEVPFIFNVANVEFLLFANDGVTLEVKNITFYKIAQ